MATQPVISNVAWSTSVAGQVLLTYNTNVNSTDATTNGNYSIPGLTVTGVTYSATTFIATITVTGYAFNTPYTVTVSNVKDVTNALTIAAPGNTFSFLNGTGSNQTANGSTSLIAPTEAEGPNHTNQNFSTSETLFGPPGGGKSTFPTEGFNVGFN